MSNVNEHNKKVLEKEYEDYLKEVKLAPVGYNQFGGEQDKTTFEFARTEAGQYIEKRTEKSSTGKTSMGVYKGVVSYQTENGEQQEYFVSDFRVASDSPLPVYSGFALDLKTGEAESFLTSHKPELVDHVETFFEATKQQAIVDAQSAAATITEQQ